MEINFKTVRELLSEKEMKLVTGSKGGDGNCPEGCGGECVYFECIGGNGYGGWGAYISGFTCSCGEAMFKCKDTDGVYCQNYI